MFDARMRVDSIRLFVFMDTVSRHALISLKMANEEDVLLDLSENVIEVKSTPKRNGNKVSTRRWTDEETDIREVAKTNQKKSGQGFSENYKYGWIYWDRLEFLIPVIRAGKSKDWHKNCFDKTCFKMFYAVWPLCKTSTCFNLKHVLACFTVKHLPFGQALTLLNRVSEVSNVPSPNQ